MCNIWNFYVKSFHGLKITYVSHLIDLDTLLLSQLFENCPLSTKKYCPLPGFYDDPWFKTTQSLIKISTGLYFYNYYDNKLL